jgi:anti-sigma factor RsiW
VTASKSNPTEVDPHLLVHAYLDGELDVAGSLALEQAIAGDPRLAGNLSEITALQNALREKFPPEQPPAYLKSRIDAAVGRKAARHRPSWALLAASVLVAIGLSSGSTWLALRTPAMSSFSAELIDSHMRALAAPQPIDVASSDTHKVKPWFNGKIPQSPRVVDLAADGFPLVGGRIDVIDKTAVPTLVYSKDLHIISLTSILSSGAEKDSMAARQIQGYNMVSWNDGVRTYWAISDLNIRDLNRFTKLFQQAS